MNTKYEDPRKKIKYNELYLIWIICSLIILCPLVITFLISNNRYNIYHGFEEKLCQPRLPYYDIKVKPLDNDVDDIKYCLFQKVGIIPGLIEAERLYICGWTKKILEDYVKENKDKLKKSYRCYYNEKKNEIKLNYLDYSWFTVAFRLLVGIEVVILAIFIIIAIKYGYS